MAWNAGGLRFLFKYNLNTGQKLVLGQGGRGQWLKGESPGLIGDRELDEYFSTLPATVAKKLYRDTLKRANKQILLPANREQAPVGTGRRYSKAGKNRARNRGRYKGGYIKKSMRTKALGRSRRQFGYMVRSVIHKPSKAKGVPYHTGYVEHGTMHQQGQHFMRDITYDKSDEVNALVVKDLRATVAAHKAGGDAKP